MGVADDASLEPLDQARAADDGAISIRQFAHELNSLLDGVMRHLRLAARDEWRDEDCRSGSHVDAAQRGLERMAALVRHAMAPEPSLQLLDNERPLGTSVPRMIDTVEPAAMESGVAVEWSIGEAASSVPTGLLETMILNGLRNGIEAAGAVSGPGRVELRIDQVGDHLEITIADNGAGLVPGGKPEGERVGLELCERVAVRIGAELTLRNVPYGGGAVLTVRVPHGVPLREDAA